MSEESALQSYADAVRTFMRDRPDLNRLIEGEEHGDDRRKKAIMEALDILNSVPPITDFTLEDCPFRTYLQDLSCSRLLQSLLFLLERNELKVVDGGGVGAVKTQIDRAAQTAAYIRKEVIPMLQEAKRAYSLGLALDASGSVGSYYYGGNW